MMRTTTPPHPDRTDGRRPGHTPNPWLQALARSMWLNPFWLLPPGSAILHDLDGAAGHQRRLP